MNDLLTKERLDSLMSNTGPHLVSIYMPAHRLPSESEQDPIRLKNLLTSAEEQLRARKLRTPDIQALLQPAYDLLGHSAFWRHQSDGLALFLGAEGMQTLRLPLHFSELVVVGDFSHVKPLLPLFAGDGRFYVLALSQNQVRLLEGTRHSVAEIMLQNVPTSLADALRYDDPESQLQFHTASAPSGAGGRPAIFHGHGVGTDDSKSNLLRYCRKLDAGLLEVLRDQDAPLVLAGVDYLLPIYREASHYKRLLAAGVPGNPDEMSVDALHAAAWPLVEPDFRSQVEAATARYAANANTERATVNLKAIVSAAHQGRIDTLFAPLGRRQWGAYDPVRDRCDLFAEQLAGARDLFDLAAVQTYLHGGTVYALAPEAIPGDATIAAIMRY